MPPRIMCINRSPVEPQDCNLGTIDLTSLSFASAGQVLNDINSSELLLSKLKDWMNEYQPVLLGVKPEDAIYLYVFDRSTSIAWRVVPVEWSGPTDLQLAHQQNIPNPKYLEFTINIKIKILGVEGQYPIRFPVREIKAYCPDISILETSGNYSRNGLGMAMSVKVVNDRNEESTPWLPFPVWMPPPLVRRFEWKEGQAQVIVGSLETPFPTPPTDAYSNYLGRKAIRDGESDVNARYGQVRWYSLNQFPQMNFLQSTASSPESSPGGQKLCIPLPGLVSNKLAELRRAGQWLYNEVTHWDDNSVAFNTPSQPGVAVIWRDDLPSKPLACFDFVKYAKELAARLWRPVLGHGTLDIDIPIPVGEMVKLKVERLEDAVNNELAKFIRNGLSVRFAFLASAIPGGPGETSNFSDSNFTDQTFLCLGSNVPEMDYSPAFDPGHIGISNQTLGFRYKPQVASNDLTDAEAGAFTLQLNIIIEGKVTIFGYEVQIPKTQLPVGPALRFHPQPVKIPTMAIFFEHPNLGGAALVALPSGTGIFDEEVHIDANASVVVSLNKARVMDELSRVKDLLVVLQVFWHDQKVDMVIRVINQITAVGRSVVDSHGIIHNAADCVIEKHWYGDSNFNDSITSVVLIGPPHYYTRTVVKCWQHSLRRPDHGYCLKLMLPDNQFVAAILDMRFLMTQSAIPILNITAPLPYGSQSSDKPNIPGNNFNDVITGIEFATE